MRASTAPLGCGGTGIGGWLTGRPGGPYGT